jgi:glycosyltransferase involved in cell wall biosynthesis
MTRDQVLIISFWNPTPEQPQQGIFIQEQAAAVCKMRDNIIFLQVNVLSARTPFLKMTVEESDFYGNKRITVNLYSALWKLWYLNPWAVSGILYRLIKKRKNEISPAIIHANVVFPCGVVGHLLAKRLESRLIISEHWSKTGKILKHHLFGRSALKAYNSSLAVICVSEFLSRRIFKSTGHGNLIVIPNIIDTEIYKYAAKLPSDDNILRMMCVASWRLPKRLDLIFEAVCSFAAESSRSMELTVVGTGSQADRLKTFKTPANLTVIWAGYLERHSIASLLQKTNVFLHASDIETFSLVTAEALSTGTPVIASDTGALPELINPQNGLLTENTPEGWLCALRQIASVKFDYEAIALQNQNKYSPESIGTKILAVYDKINPGE